jgi:uncharacterized pyridoxamine 5'-phosphate oxidase family protein
MQLSDAIKFANDNPICYLATVDGDQPRVRGFRMLYADDSGFYFHTGAKKAVCDQLKRNPKAEVCFFAPSPSEKDGGVMLRIAGSVEFVDDRAIKERVLQEMPFLKEIGVTSPDDSMLTIFKISSGEAHFWTLADELQHHEPDWVKF